MILSDSVLRNHIAVIVPFAGDERQLKSVLSDLEDLCLSPGDEVVVVHNSADNPPAIFGHTARILAAREEGSSYYARNVGAAETAAPWLLFVDADCRPPKDLLRIYRSHLPDDESIGAIAGGIEGGPGNSIVERYARARGHLDAQSAFAQGFGATANLLVRRTAFESVGGFVTGIRSAGDREFCGRLAAMGWSLQLCLPASVGHAHRASISDLVTQYRRYGAGANWLASYKNGNRRKPVALALARVLLGVVRCLVGVLYRQRDLATFGLLDVLANSAFLRGMCEGNGPYWRSDSR